MQGQVALFCPQRKEPGEKLFAMLELAGNCARTRTRSQRLALLKSVSNERWLL